MKRYTLVEAATMAADLFEAVPEAWTQEVRAINKDGFQCLPDAPEACQWCVGGALSTLTGLDAYGWKIVRFLGEGESYWLINDRNGREAAIGMLRRAVERAAK